MIAKHVGTDIQGWSSVSLVSEGDMYAVGKLGRCNPELMKGRLAKQFARSELKQVPVYGAVDFALDLTGKAQFSAHWYLLVRASPDECREALERYYPQTLSVARPMVAKGVRSEEAIHPATYLFKSTFKERRRSFDYRGNSSTQHAELFGDPLVELLKVLDSWGFVRRIFQRNV